MDRIYKAKYLQYRTDYFKSNNTTDRLKYKKYKAKCKETQVGGRPCFYNQWQRDKDCFTNQIKNRQRTNLINANLSEYVLENMDLRGFILSGANLSGAKLSGANLSGIDLQTTIFDNKTIMDNVNLEGSTLPYDRGILANWYTKGWIKDGSFKNATWRNINLSEVTSKLFALREQEINQINRAKTNGLIVKLPTPTADTLIDESISINNQPSMGPREMRLVRASGIYHDRNSFQKDVTMAGKLSTYIMESYEIRREKEREMSRGNRRISY